ncbi:MAG: four helix bundle protein [Phycisphaerae bacterium]|nr:four helix bundle protein [Phycisphaerae bacterium]
MENEYGSSGDASPFDIAERTFGFALRILKVVRALPHDVYGHVFAKQLIRSGTSVGANIEEAQGLHTRKDFARRMNIARTEARETLYWLRLIAEDGMLQRERLTDLISEADEIARILTTIVKNARRDESQ